MLHSKIIPSMLYKYEHTFRSLIVIRADATKPLLIQSYVQMNHLPMSPQVLKRTTVLRKDRLSQYLFQAVPRPRLVTLCLGRLLSPLLRPRVLLYLYSHLHPLQPRGVDGFVISSLLPLALNISRCGCFGSSTVET